MKTLGAALVVVGLLMSVLGYGSYSVVCHCPVQMPSKSLNCHCNENLAQSIGHIMVYAGLAVIAGGIAFFVCGWRKKVILN